MHPDSDFTTFRLPLRDGQQITGLRFIPPSVHKFLPHVPLVVAIPGGTCKATTFDLAKKYTASIAAKNLEIPVVAINRLNYADSSKFVAPEGVGYRQEEGRLTHELILPALWDAFGKPNGCTAIVILAHSMGVPGSIVAGALHAQESAPTYPLGGMILTGWGTRLAPRGAAGDVAVDPSGPREIMWSMEIKRQIMLSQPELECGDPSILEALEQEHTYILLAELQGTYEWFEYWKQFAGKVKTSIMIAYGEHDILWMGTKEHAQEFAAEFPQSERVDTSIVLGAPHSLELWWGSTAWYHRAFAWAAEVCTSMALKRIQQKAASS